MTALEIIQCQLEAYNARDLERFLSTYSETIQVYRPPTVEPTIAGKAQLSQFYATERFNCVDLRAELVNRMVLGNRVIDHERVWGVGEAPFEVAAVYDVGDNYIQTVWFFAAQ